MGKPMMESPRVTHCPPFERGMKREKPRKRVYFAPANGHDLDVCAACANKGRCENPCYPLTWIIDDKPLKEKLLAEPIEDTFNMPDYNVILYDLSSTSAPIDRIGEILKVHNLRKRAICAMLAVRIPRQNIAALLSITRQHLARLIGDLTRGG